MNTDTQDKIKELQEEIKKLKGAYDEAMEEAEHFKIRIGETSDELSDLLSKEIKNQK